MSRQHTPILNQAQQQLLDLICDEKNLVFFASLRDDISPWPEYEKIENFLCKLGNYMQGEFPANFADCIEKISSLKSHKKNDADQVNRVLLTKFITCIEDLYKAAKKNPFPKLTSDQILAIKIIYDNNFIYYCHSYQTIHQDNKAIQLLHAMKAMALGENNRMEIYFIMAFMLYRVESSNVPNPNKNKQRALKGYLFDQVSKTLFPASFFDKILGATFAALILSPIFIIAHNPVYHFLHLFRSRESKKFHLSKIITYPAFILATPVFAFASGYIFGIQGISHHFAYVAGRQFKGLTVISLLIIASAIIASLAVIFFPPAIPFLMTTLPLLSTLSPALLSVTAGLVTCLALTALSSAAIFTYTRCSNSVPPAIQITNSLLPPDAPPASAQPNSLREAALGKPEDYQPIIAIGALAEDSLQKPANTPIPGL